MYTALLQHIQRFVSLTEEEIHVLASYLTEKKPSKKEFLFQEGQVCTANYFVAKGCLRLYYVNDKGIETIVQFAIENWWISDYQSLERQIPSPFYLQAIESSTVIVLEKQVQEELLTKSPSLERYFRIVAQRAYGAAQMRIKYISELSGEERYVQFTESFPDFVQRIPQYMLASYLGFTPEFLSKLRAKKR
ncbi:MAG: cAMP-binding protein [Chitinophagaceae bacterium]|nr:cAMP-binding protein [Chitinophagaceae bacterium]